MRRGLVGREHRYGTVNTDRWGQGKPRAKTAQPKGTLPHTTSHSALAHFASSSRPILVAIIAVFLLGMMAAWAQTSGNPKVPQNYINSFPSTSWPLTMEPGLLHQWDILDPSGTIIATQQQPNGWSVAFSSSASSPAMFTVGAPLNAVIATDYKVRYVTDVYLSGGQVIPIGVGNPQSNGVSRIPLARSQIPEAVTKLNKNRINLNLKSSATVIDPNPNYPASFSRAGHVQSDNQNRRGDRPQTFSGGTPVNPVNPASPVNPSSPGYNWYMRRVALFDVVAARAPTTPPDAPTNLVARAISAHRIALKWDDNSNDENGFKIERKIGSAGAWSLVTTVSTNTTGTATFTNVGLAPSTSYTYRVRAYNQVGDSAYSNEATATTQKEPAPQSGNMGRDFWLAFPGVYPDNTFVHDLQLLINSDVAASGTVSVPGLGFSQSFSVAAGAGTTVSVPYGAALNDEDAISNLGVHIEADVSVRVAGLHYQRYGSEGYLGLPVPALGRDYLVLAYPTLDYPQRATTNGMRSQLSLVATQDNTSVTITPSVACGIAGSEHTAGVPFTFVVNKGQTYQLRAAARNTDLSGSHVVSSKPIAVWAGAQDCFTPSAAYGMANPLMEQLLPTKYWGKEFVAAPLATRGGGDTYRIIAAQDNTEIIVNENGTPHALLLMRGEVTQQIIAGPVTVYADKPIQVAQISNGHYYDNGQSLYGADPLMALVPAINQYQNGYLITTTSATQDSLHHFVNLVVKADKAASGDISLDGTPIDASAFSPIDGEYAYTQIQLALPGGHTISSASETPFGAMEYGYEEAEGYGWPAGMKLPMEGGLRGEYFDNSNFTAPVMTRVDNTIDFNWYRYLPHVTMAQTDFSVRWTGQVIPETTETYTFITTVDDGVRLWVDGQLLIDEWHIAPSNEYAATVSLEAGHRYDIRIEYNNTEYSGMMRLEWATPTVPRQLVPGHCLLPYPLPNANTPEPPSNLAATASPAVGGHINLSWTDNSDDEDGFRIERKTGDFGDWKELSSVSANVTVYADSGLAPATTYYYRVRAFNIHANSEYSNEASTGILLGGNEGWPLTVVITNPALGSIFMPPATIPVAAVAVAAQGSGSNPTVVSVRFDLIAFADPAPVVQTVTVTSPPYESAFTNVPTGNYRLRATVTDSAGNTATDFLDFVGVKSSIGGIGAPPAAPTGLSATAVSNSQIKLAWTDASNNEQGFKLERKTGSGAWSQVAQIGANATNYTAGGLTRDTTYTYRLRAYNTYGNSAYSNEASATTLDVALNIPPTVQITAPASGASFTEGMIISLAATASDSDGTVNTVAFKEGGTVIGQGASDGQGGWTYDWYGATVGSHTVTAVATDNRGATTTSAPVTITVTSGNSGGDFTVVITSPQDGDTFTAPATIPISATATDDFGTVMWVDFYADDGINGPILIGTATSGNPFTFSWASVPEGEYTLTAIATDDGGLTAESDPVTVVVDGSNGGGSGSEFTVTITSPTNGATFAVPATVPISATVVDTISTVAKVDFYAYDETTVAHHIGSTTTGNPYQFSWANVPAGTYKLMAIATDDQGASATSNIVKVIVTDNSPAPSSDAPSYIAVYPTGATSLRIYWASVQGATEYKIYRDTTPGLAAQATVPIATVPNTPLFYDDFGLQTGQMYYYVVRAIRGGVILPPSYEYGFYPNPDGIPWHLTSADIIAKVKSLVQAGPDDWEYDDPGPVTVMAPDGIVYEEGQAIPLPRNATYMVGGSMVVEHLGRQIPLNPDFLRLDSDNGSGGGSGQSLRESKGNSQGVLARPMGSADGNALGAMRRVRSMSTIMINGTEKRVIGVQGAYRLPKRADIFIPEKNYPHVYVGLSGPAEIDAGISFEHAVTSDGVSYPDRWTPFMRVNDDKNRTLTPESVRVLFGNQWVDYSLAHPYSPQGLNDIMRIYALLPASGCMFTLAVTPFNQAIQGGTIKTGILFVSFACNDLTTPVPAVVKPPAFLAKRVSSLDQQKSNLPDGRYYRFNNAANAEATPGYYSDQAFMKGLKWTGGELIYSGINDFGINPFLSTPWTMDMIPPGNPTQDPNWIFKQLGFDTYDWYCSRRAVDNKYMVTVNGKGDTQNETMSLSHKGQ